MPAFNDEIFDSEIEAKYRCPICLFALKDPVQTPCGHLFCYKCITAAIRKFDAVCPVDNTSLTEPQLQADNAVKEQMSCFKVKCSNQGYGCGWKGTLGQFESHHQNCSFFPTKKKGGLSKPQQYPQ